MASSRALLGPSLAALLSTACTCEDTKAPTLHVSSGQATPEPIAFSPKTALVEYVEVSGKKNELIIQLASDEVPCGEFRPAAPDATRVSVTLVLPPGVVPEAKVYTAAPADDGGAATSNIITTLRVGASSRVLPPGGHLELRTVDLSEGGHLSGILALEFAGTPESEPASVRGRFSARVCRLDLRSGK
jgi:hypothetical protein